MPDNLALFDSPINQQIIIMQDPVHQIITKQCPINTSNKYTIYPQTQTK